MRDKSMKFGLAVAMLLPMLTPISALAVAPGETITVVGNCGTIEGKVSAVGENVKVTDYNDWCDRGGTVTAKGTVIATGRASLSIVTVEATDSADPANPVAANGVMLGSDVVTVTNPIEQQPNDNKPENPEEPNEPQSKKSSDATLSDLIISEGTLNPAFSSDTTNYTVALQNDVTSIRVEAQANHDKTSISGTGEVSLQPGSNEIEIICTAEDGSVKTYSIKVSVDETPDIFVEYGGKKIGVVKNLEGVSAPETFEETTVEMNGAETRGYHSNQMNLTIVYMMDDAGEKNWYLYDPSSKSVTSIYQPVALLGRNIAIVDIPEELQIKTGMIYGVVTVDEHTLMGWTFEDAAFANYALIYVMDDQGRMQYYLYEKSENTLQLYSGQAAVSQDDYEGLQDAITQRMMMILALLITNIITILMLIIVMFKKRKKRQPKKRYIQETDAQNEEIEKITASDATVDEAEQ